MRTILVFSVVSAIVLVAQPLRALAWGAMSYAEAVQRCNWGDPYACGVVRQYHAAQTGPWMSQQELNTTRRGPLSTYDFVR